MVRFIRVLVAAVVGAGAAAVGSAGPAHGQGDVNAPGIPEGVYTVNIDGQASTTWEIYPICAPVVGDLREPLLLPVGCRLKVTPAGQPGAESTMVGGRWTFTYDTIDGRTCPDGRKVPQKTVYSFDPYTWVGDMEVFHGGECFDQPGMYKVPLTMSFKEPLAIPVTEYPLICEPGGLRRCF